MKVLDRIALQHQKCATDSVIHPMQYGFTSGRSGTHAAFILSESILEAKECDQVLLVATLDVQKAFDTVQHAGLLDKLLGPIL